MKQYYLNELTDSRLLYDKKPPKFLFYILGLTLLFVCGIAITSLFVHKPYVVKASGIVSSNKKTSLTSNVSGTITSCNLKEGQAVQQGDIIMTFDDTETRIQIEKYASLIEYYDNQIVLFERCINEVNENTNTFSKDNQEEAFFYYLIQAYQNQRDQNTQTDEYYKTMGYSTKQIATQQERAALQVEGLKYQTISELSAKQVSTEAEKRSATAQYESLVKLLDTFSVTAPQSGIVHLNGDIQPGMSLQSGTVIGSVSSNYLSDFEIEAYVSAQDRSKIYIGSKAEIAVSGILQNEYGVLTGKIKSIDNDATVNQDNSAVYYKVKIILDNTGLTNKSGETTTISLGMVTQCNIQYKDSTWFVWALDQIGLKSVQ